MDYVDMTAHAELIDGDDFDDETTTIFDCVTVNMGVHEAHLLRWAAEHYADKPYTLCFMAQLHRAHNLDRLSGR